MFSLSRPPSWSSGEPGAQPVIGVGFDGSPGARDALALASLGARATGGWLMLICAAYAPLEEQVLGGSTVTEVHRERAWTMLEDARDELGLDAQIEVRSDAFVWRALRHVVRFKRADVLVVGSSHDAPEGRVGIGRHVADLQQHLERPLAIAPRGFAGRTDARLDRIGVGFDGGAESEAAVSLAASIAALAHAELQACDVIPERVPVDPTGEAILERRVASLSNGAPVAAELEVTSGAVHDVLLETSHRVDLLVVGSGRNAQRGRVLLGGAGWALAHGAACPIVIAPRPEA